MSSVSCLLCFTLEGRGCLKLGTVNSTNPWGEREFKEEKCYSNEVDQQRISWGTLCVFLGLTKPGDFTVSEGHGYPLVYVVPLKVLLVGLPKRNQLHLDI